MGFEKFKAATDLHKIKNIQFYNIQTFVFFTSNYKSQSTVNKYVNLLKKQLKTICKCRHKIKYSVSTFDIKYNY